MRPLLRVSLQLSLVSASHKSEANGTVASDPHVNMGSDDVLGLGNSARIKRTSVQICGEKTVTCSSRCIDWHHCNAARPCSAAVNLQSATAAYAAELQCTVS